MVQIRPRPELTNNSQKKDPSCSGKKKYSFFQSIETSIIFWEGNKKTMSQATSNDIRAWNKNT